MPRKWKLKYYCLMRCLSSPLHHVVGITEVIALYSHVTRFHSSPSHQMEMQTLCSAAQSEKQIPSFVVLKMSGPFLVQYQVHTQSRFVAALKKDSYLVWDYYYKSHSLLTNVKRSEVSTCKYKNVQICGRYQSFWDLTYLQIMSKFKAVLQFKNEKKCVWKLQ